MPLVPQLIVQSFPGNPSDQLGQQISVAGTEIANEQLQREREGAQRDSLVTAYTEKVYNEFAKYDSGIRACVVTVASLPIETNNLKYVGNEIIGGWGYTIQVGYKGSWIKNKGARGFENWCVVGSSHQTNDIIYID